MSVHNILFYQINICEKGFLARRQYVLAFKLHFYSKLQFCIGYSRYALHCNLGLNNSLPLKQELKIHIIENNVSMNLYVKLPYVKVVDYFRLFPLRWISLFWKFCMYASSNEKVGSAAR